MKPPAVASPLARSASLAGGVLVERVTLLGVRVTACVVINVAEHRRREAAGMGAVVSPGLLDRLLNMPVAVPVSDPAAWAEMAGQPPGVLERSEDGAVITRRLESPLTILDVVVDAAPGRELRAVQEASLFAGFTRRWVAAAGGRIPEATLLEAKMCGVGVIGPHGEVLAAEKPVSLTVDRWSWLLEEKAYRYWTGSPAPATGGASVSPAR